MSICAKCSLVQRLSLGGEVVIFSGTTYLIHRIAEVFDFKQHHTTLTLEVVHFAQFIQKLLASVELTSTEQNNLMVAHLLPGESYGPDLLGRCRSLSQWARLTVDSPLLQVLQNEAITTFFQPIVDLNQGNIYGYECLSRGRAADGRLIPPNRLFEEAQESDLLFNLDRLMREKSLINANQAGIKKHIFINFLPTAVYNPEFCLKSTMRWVDEFGFDPSQIVFEVVETEKVIDSSHLVRILTFYREKGFKIALDDVAAGYSGLLQLLTIRPDIMKIDRQVVDGIHANRDKQVIFRAMMGIASDYSIIPLAEGIEDPRDLNFLKDNKVSLAQGYLFGKPQSSPQPRAKNLTT